jgi:hypothetical protein
MKYTGDSRRVIQEVPQEPRVASRQAKVNSAANIAVWHQRSVTPASVGREGKLTSDIAEPASDSHKWEYTRY